MAAPWNRHIERRKKIPASMMRAAGPFHVEGDRASAMGDTPAMDADARAARRPAMPKRDAERAQKTACRAAYGGGKSERQIGRRFP